MVFLIGVLIGLTTIMFANLQKVYAHIPPKELKRRAREGDHVAETLYRVAAYGASLRTVLWILMCVTGASFVVFMSLSFPLWLAVLTGMLLIWVGFIWLPEVRTTKYGVRVAAVVAPPLSKILYYLHSPITRVLEVIRKHKPLHFHTGMYERADLLDLIDAQQQQKDNRMSKGELDIVRGALTFVDKLIRDVMIPRRVVNSVDAGDGVGPILISELHASGHSRFPVYEGKEENTVGVLFLRDLAGVDKKGKVKDFMKKEVAYLHEEQTLFDALQAVKKTHNHLYIVVNSFEEYVGIITLEDVLEQIIGSPVMDEFDQYEDMRAVAARAAKVIHKEHAKEDVKAKEKSNYKPPQPDETIEIE